MTMDDASDGTRFRIPNSGRWTFVNLRAPHLYACSYGYFHCVCCDPLWCYVRYSQVEPGYERVRAASERAKWRVRRYRVP
jgi:hypothetical protein